MALHRPYIRQEVRAEVERRAERNESGQFLDANTHKPIEGQYDLGHKAGHEHWREAKQAEKEGLTQDEFNDRMNNPELYQIEDPHENRSHTYEMPVDRKEDDSRPQMQTESNPEGRKAMDERNGFVESIKLDKVTIDRCNEVSRNAAKNANTQSERSGVDDGGRERGDTGPGSLGRESGNKGGHSSASSTPGEGHGASGQGASGQGSGGQGSGGQGAGGHGGH